MAESLSRSAQKVQDVLTAKGFDLHVVELPDSTRTAVEAAAAVGCTVAQIAKSIVLRTVAEQRPVLVVTSGVNRVNEDAIAAALGAAVEKADAAFVRQHTGFVIGGVPPVGHPEQLTIFIDADLLALDVLWVAAGTPRAVFQLTPAQLLELTAGQVLAVAQAR